MKPQLELGGSSRRAALGAIVHDDVVAQEELGRLQREGESFVELLKLGVGSGLRAYAL